MPSILSTRTRVKAPLLALVLGLVVVIGLGLTTTKQADAAASSYLNFQARLLTSGGAIVPDGSYNIRFKIYDANSGGSNLWTETHDYNGGSPDNRVRVINGYMSVKLGSINAFSGINWDQQMWMTMNIGGSTTSPSYDGEMLDSGDRIQLTAVPLAFSANQLAAGTGSSRGTLSFASLGQATAITLPDPASGSATVCYQNANACGFALGSGTAFVQNGNSFGATAVLGTNDSNSLTFETNNTTQATIAVGGATTFKNSTNSATAFQVQDASSNPIFGVNTSTKSIGINVAPTGTYGEALELTHATYAPSTWNMLQDNYYTVSGSSSSYNGATGLEIDVTNNVTGTGYSEAFGALVSASSANDAYVQHIRGYEAGLTTHSGDEAYGFQVYDPQASTGGTQYGLYVDLNDPDTTKYPAFLSSAGQDQLFLQSTGSNRAGISINNLSGGQQSVITFSDASTAKWQIGKQTDNTLLIYDAANSRSTIATDSSGNLQLQPTAGNVIVGSTATPSAVLHVSNAGSGTDLFKVTDTTATSRDVLKVADGGAVTLRNQTNSADAFEVQMSDGNSLLSVDTANAQIINNSLTTIGNEIQNPSFEGSAGALVTAYNSKGWSKTTGSTYSVVTDAANAHGAYNSLQGTPNGVVSDAYTHIYKVTPGETIYLEAYVKTAGGTNGSGGISLGFEDKDFTNDTYVSDSRTAASIGTTYTLLHIKTTVPAGYYYMYAIADMRDTSTTGTWYFDDFYMRRSNEIAPVLFQNSVDSSTAFQIQNAAGKNILATDTTSGIAILGNSGASGVTGTLKFNYSGQTGSISLVPLTPSSTAYTLNLPAENGTICSTGSVCSGYAPSSGSTVYATRQLDNLSSVAINTSLLPATDDSIDLGDNTHRWANAYLGGETLHLGTSTTDEAVLSYTTSSNTFNIGNNASSSNSGILLKNAADSATAFQIQNSAGSTLMAADTTNLKVAVTGDVNVGTRYGNRLFSDNFESGGFKLWNSGTTGTIAIDTTTVHDGKYSAKVNPTAGTGYASTSINSSSATAYVRLWENTTSASNDFNYATLYAGAQALASLTRQNSTGKVCIYNNWAGGIAGCSASAVSNSAWHLLEMRQTVNNTTSTLTLWVDGTQEYTTSAASLSTVNADTLQLGDGASRTEVFYLDDVSVDSATNGTASSLNVDDSFHVGGTSSFGSSVLIQTASNSTTAFQVQNAAGTSNAFVVDTTNTRVGIGTNAPATALQVATAGSRISIGDYGGGQNIFLGEYNNADTDVLQLQGRSGIKLTTGSAGVNTVLDLSATGQATFKNSSDSTTAFQIQNSSGTTLFNADSSALNLLNYIYNPSFETNLNGWSADGSPSTFSYTDTASNVNFGSRALNVVTTTTAGQGAKYTIPLPVSTTFTLSWYDKKTDANAFTDVVAGYALDGSTESDCTGINTATVSSSYTQHTCTITTSSTQPSSTSYIYIQQNGAQSGGHTWFIDGVTLVASGTAQAYNAGGGQFNLQGGSGNISLNAANTGEPQAWQLSPNLLGHNTADEGTAIYNGYIYTIGGHDGSNALSEVRYAKLYSNGAIGTWATTSSITSARDDAGFVISNGYMYVIGGDAASAAHSEVYYAKINMDGTVGTFQTNAYALGCATAGCGSPVLRREVTAVAANGYIYAIGGDNGSTATNTVYYAKQYADGSLGAWATTSTITNVRAWHTSVVANGYVYIIGGVDASLARAEVYYAKLNADGTLGTFAATSSMPDARYRSASVVVNGYIYEIGGIGSSGNSQKDVYYAKINSDGTIGAWATATNQLPDAKMSTAAATVNGYIYLLGGWRLNFSAVTQTVFYTSTPRIMVGGSLDLVGLGGQLLGDVGGTGGDLTARNGIFVGSTQVLGDASFASNVAVDKDLKVGGSVLFQNAANSATAFQIQNSSGTNLLTVDTTNMYINVPNGTSIFQSPDGPVYKGGADTLNAGTGTDSMRDVFVSGRYMYAARGTGNSGTCSSSTRDGCELMIFDVSDPTSPVYKGGADGLNAGNGADGFRGVYVAGHYAYVSRGTGNSGTCSSSTRDGCEILIFDVSNPTSPTYVGGADGVNAGNGADAMSGLYVSGRYLYVSRADPDGGTCSSSTRDGCEFMVFDVANPSTPVYKGGADSINAGTGSTDSFSSIFVSGRYAYVTRSAGNAGTCSSGTRDGCEFMIFDISDPTNPTYKGGADSLNAGNGTNSMFGVYVQGRYAYVTQLSGSSSTCSSATRDGCEFMIFDISDPTSPVYKGGADGVNAGNSTNSMRGVFVSGRYAYVNRSAGNSGTCSTTTRDGCEFLVFDISDPTSPAFKGGADSINAGNGTDGGRWVFVSGRYAYVAQSVANGGTCSSATRDGCEIKIFDISGAEVTSLLANSLDAATISVQTNASIYNNLNVGGALNVGQSAQIQGDLAVNGNALFQNQTNSTTAFQIQNAAGGQLIGVDSTNSNITLNGLNSGDDQVWATTTAASAHTNHSACTLNGYVYVFDNSANQFAKLNSDGTISSWTNLTATPQAEDQAGCAVANGYIYYIGGQNGSAGLTTVSYVRPNADGQITSTWNTTTSLPVALRQVGVTAYKGYIYVVGGTNGGGPKTSAYYAKVNADGTLGSWGNTAFSTALEEVAVVAANGYIYKLGGNTLGNSPTNTVEHAPLSATDGSIGAWTSVGDTVLPVNLRDHQAVTLNGFVYVFGGDSGSVTGNVYYASLNADGSLGSWTTASNAMNVAKNCHAGFAANGYIYAIGGAPNTACGGGASSTVQYTSTERVKLGGSLDLVNLGGERLNDPGSAGSITAGNITAVGDLQVQGGANITGSISINGNLTNTGSALFKNTVNSTTAFQIQTSTGSSLFNTNTLDLTSLNKIYNPSFEQNTNGWTVRTTGAATISYTDTAANVNFGNRALQVNATTTAGDGAKYNITLPISSTFTISWYDKVASGSIADITAGYSLDGTTGNEVDCTSINTQAVSTSYTQHTCTITTTSTVPTSTSYIYIQQNGAQGGSHTIYVDGVTLVSGSTAQTFNAGGNQVDLQSGSGNINLNANSTADVQAWQLNANVVGSRSSNNDVILNGYYYEMDSATCRYGKVNADGSIGSLAASFTCPATDTMSFTTANGYIYSFAGSTATAVVSYAKPAADGGISAWTATTSIPAARKYVGAVTANGYIYAVGGEDSGATKVQTVYYARLNADGTIGSWSTSANTLPVADDGLWKQTVVANGYIYVVGGNTGTPENDVYYSALNATSGDVGSWTTQSNWLPAGLVDTGVAIINGYLYAVAGQTGGGFTATNAVYYGALNADGSIGTASTSSNPLPDVRSLFGFASYNGYMYVSEGKNAAGTSQGTIFYTSTSRIKINGSLDLVGISGENLVNGGSGGSLTAGDTNIIGNLQVQNGINIAGGISVGGNLISRGSALFKNTADSTTAFQVQSSGAVPIFNVDTSSGIAKITGISGATGDGALQLEDTDSGGIVWMLDPQGTGSIAIGTTANNSLLSLSSTGATVFKNSTDSTTAFQIQNVATTALLNVNTTSSIITFNGTTTTFASVVLSEAHFKSSQTNKPTIGTPTNCGSGTPTATVANNSTDSAGSFTITNNGSNGTSCDTIFTFNKAYGAAPKSIVLTATNVDAAVRDIYLSASSTTTFTVKFATSPTTNPTSFTFNYWIVE